MASLIYTVGGIDNLVSFQSTARVPIENLKVYFNPIQDLHGYSKPWPSGGEANKLEDEFESGYLHPSSGNPTPGINYTRSKNYNPCTANTEYYCVCSPSVPTCVILFYDAQYSYISNINSLSNKSFTTPEDAAYFKMYFNAYVENIGINYPATVKSYIPYSNICSINGWNSIEVYQDDIYLPPEYQRVEWIESSGTQWIDTGIVPDGYTKAQIKVMNLKYTGDVILGCYGDSDTTDWRLFNYNQIIYLDCPGPPALGVRNFSGSFLQNYVYEFEVGYAYVKDLRLNQIILGSEKNSDFDRAAAGTITLNNYANKSYSSNRWYYVKIFNNETLTRNMIPCRRKSDNKPGMYDTVSGEFFTNQGTGEFIYGPDIGINIPVTFPAVGKNKLNNASSFWEVGSMDMIGRKDGRTTRIRTKDFISAEPKTTYTVSIDEGYSVALDEFASGVHNVYHGWSSNSYTFTTRANTNQLFFIIKKDSEIDITPSILDNDCHIQLEIGDTATEYEPFDNTVYGGYIDIAKGELVKTHAIYIFTGEEYLEKTHYSLNPIGHIFDSRYNKSKGYDSSYKLSEVACNKLKFETSRYHYVHEGCIAIGRSNQTVSILFNDTDVFGSTAEEAKAKLTEWYNNGDPMIIAAKLQKEYYIHYPLTRTYLQTLLGPNNIWSNTGSLTELGYSIHDSASIRAAKKRIADNEPHIETASGSLINFNTDMTAPLKKCKVYFNPVQEGSGDPSLDNVRAISGWNNINIHKTGKNLIDENYLANANNYPNSGNYGYHYTNDIQLIPNTRYRFVWYNYDNTPLSEFGVTSINLYVQGANEYIVNNAKYKQYSSGFLTPSTGIIRFGIYHPSALQRQDVLNAIFNNGKLMLQIGTDDIAYESYSGTTVPITFPSEAGTVYGGYADLITGEVWATDKSKIVNGTEDWYIQSPHDRYNAIFTAQLDSAMRGAKSDYDHVGYTNWLPERMSPSDQQIGGPLCCKFGWGDTRLYILNAIEHLEGVTDVQSLKTYLSTHNLQAVYPLRVPQLITTLTPTQLKTLRGTNNIWSNANGNIELSYWKH